MLGRERNAFTLIELLVVAAVVFVLAGLLFPVLGKAKERAWRAACMSNERQLALTWLIYADDNQEKLVQNGYVYGGGDAKRPMWVQGYYNHAVCPSDSTNELVLTDWRFSQFAPYLRSSKVYHCPANRQTVHLRGPKERAGPRVVKIRSYSMNWFLGWMYEPTSRNPPEEFRRFRKTGELQPRAPSQLIVFTDLHPESICWPFFGISAQPEFFMFPGTYHNRRGIIAWADGHVETKRWADDRTMGAVVDGGSGSSGVIEWHTHQHPSQGNADLSWMLAHSSIPK